MWKTKEIQVEDLFIGVKKKLVFEYEGTLELATRFFGSPQIDVSCGCVKTKLVGNTIEVEYTPKNIPKHLEAIGAVMYPTKKTITVTHSNGKVDELIIRGIVKKQN